jgi:predicted nucleic acid-binding protein
VIGECIGTIAKQRSSPRLEVFRRADELSEKHAAAEGQRAIDLLHVAIALESGGQIFLSFDRRQRRLAKAAGLKAQP